VALGARLGIDAGALDSDALGGLAGDVIVGGLPDSARAHPPRRAREAAVVTCARRVLADGETEVVPSALLGAINRAAKD
jgi:hypothetical protein